MKLRRTTDGLLMFDCPGCLCSHGVWVALSNPLTEGKWEWNGSMNQPTFTPSILVRGTVPITDDEHRRIMAGEHIEPKPLVCHSFVRNGQIQFLSDCTHNLAGQTVDLPEIE